MESSESSLAVEVKDGVLMIRLGVETLKWAAEHMKANNPYDEEMGSFRRLWKITDATKFADDVRHALTEEEEDSSTVLTELFDKAALAAIEDGSIAVEDVSDPERPPGVGG